MSLQFDGVSPYGPYVSRGAPRSRQNGDRKKEVEGHVSKETEDNELEDNQAKTPNRGNDADESGGIPLDRHVFQTIFLDNSPESSALWSKDEINPEKVNAFPRCFPVSRAG